MSLFKPAAWDSTVEVFNFQSAKKNSQNSVEKTNKNIANEILKKKQKNKVKKTSIKNGRIEKRKQKKLQKQKLIPKGLQRPVKPINSDDEDSSSADSSAESDSDGGIGSKQKVIKSGRIEKNKLKRVEKLNKSKLTEVHNKNVAAVTAATNELKLITPANAQFSAYQEKLKSQLVGGRFRFINEQLYTMSSQKAVELFTADREAYTAYHEGFRHQSEQWPFNPLKRIIKTIKNLPKTFEIGDFGCGDAELAKSVPNKVYSIDLVSAKPDIIACDMAHTPLKKESLDVAVYCLSLMGTNLKDFMLEANRVLKVDGLLYIVEIQTRFDNVQDFIQRLRSCGFQLVRKDMLSKLFLFFQFKKVQSIGKVAIVKPFQLKPCLYRKR
ncbi:ribosomal RNA-processing protein 8-like [Teleopsis dalmanni]|uniref:ribosomal RNA-processing protein 8-like n=1 Tax=Teleopsis dalmanni TaxID=139649 RepID=UPI0018CDB901|nr:ribosomal RNA-processing protein 8-like [Teleopsis dalmanni]XP_037948036.1 ribosomal RNA-processing protein 8-like [Teleopsis dalmanni]